MIKNIAFVVLLALRLSYQPSAKEHNVPFTSPAPAPPPAVSVMKATVVSLNSTINGNKVLLNWIVNDNESAAHFEVEKSSDGKNFATAALVFGTDKNETDTYQFYEKAAKKKLIYRIKIINKSQVVEYSSEIVVKPAAWFINLNYPICQIQQKRF